MPNIRTYCRYGAVLAAVAALLALGGCDRGKPSAKEGGNSVVAVGSQWYGHIPVWIGIERGIFRQHGFEVTWRTIGKSIDRLNAISSGEAQFASLGEIAMLSAMAQGNRRFYWVGNQDIAPGFEGLVARPGIKKVSDLKGKRIGFPFGSSVEVTVRQIVRAHGLDPARDVKLVNLEVGDVPAVFRAGNVDAAGIWEPGFSKLLEVPGATLLGRDTDTEIYRRFGTMTGPDVLILSKEWADADPARARRFLVAYFEALAWTRDNVDDATKLVHEKYIQQDLNLIRSNVKKFVWLGASEQGKILSDAGMFGQAEFLLGILHDQMRALPAKPDFRAWVKRDLLPPG